MDSTLSGGSQFNLNCTHFTEEQLKHCNLIRSVAAAVYAVLLLSISVLLICHKAFSSTFQRLYFYLLIVTFLVEVFISLSAERQFQYKGQSDVCVFLGFTTQWLSVIQMFYTFEIVAYLFCLVIHSIQKNRFQVTKIYQRLTEVLLTLTPVLLAFIFSWEPYMSGNRYGLAGPFCWIRTEDENCHHVGTRDQMIYYGLYEILGFTGIIAHVVFAIVYCKLASSLREARYLLRQTLIVMVFQFAYTLSITYQLGVRLYTGLSKIQSHYSLWLAFSVVSPIRQLLFPIGCFFCFYPVKDMLLEYYRKVQRCCHKQQSSSYGEIENPYFTGHATTPESTRISQPSSTFFVVPHPNESTGELENSHLVSKNST